MKLPSIRCMNPKADNLSFKEVDVVSLGSELAPTSSQAPFYFILSNFLGYHSGQETCFQLQATGHTTSLAEMKPCGLRLTVIIQDSDSTTD